MFMNIFTFVAYQFWESISIYHHNSALLKLFKPFATYLPSLFHISYFQSTQILHFVNHVIIMNQQYEIWDFCSHTYRFCDLKTENQFSYYHEIRVSRCEILRYFLRLLLERFPLEGASDIASTSYTLWDWRLRWRWGRVGEWEMLWPRIHKTWSWADKTNCPAGC